MVHIEEMRALHYECTRFSNLEADLLDSRRFNEWFQLISKEIEYKVPVRITRDNSHGVRGEFTEDNHFDDNWDSMKARVDRLRSEYAWSENPASRTLRLVGNVIVERGDDKSIDFKNKFMIYRGFWEDPAHDLVCGERHDRLIKEDGQWKLRKRLVLLSHTSIPTRNLAIFL